MANAHFRVGARACFPFLAAGLLFGFAAGSRAADQASSKAARETEADVRAALRQAQGLSARDRTKALDTLTEILKRLEGDHTLAADRKRSLVRLVKDRIRVTQSAGTADADSVAAATSKRDAENEKTREDRQFQRLFEEIKQLRRDGRLDKAGDRGRELAGRNAKNPAVTALNRSNEIAKQIEANRDLQNESERRLGPTLREVDRSGLPPTGDVEYPKDWKTKSQTRKPTNTVRMTAKEKSILQALDSTISLDFKDSPFEQVIDYITTLTGQPIVVDKAALDAAGVNYETQVTLKLKDVSLRFLLRRLLAQYGLSYIVKDEAIQVMTLDQAKNTMVTRVHDIRNLLPFDELLAFIEAKRLIETIESTIDPGSWDRNGGPGTIAYEPATRSLVIKQSGFHGTLAGGLSSKP